MAIINAVKSRMPADTQFIADLAFDIGPQIGVDPVLIVAITRHESGWGKSLTPPTPAGTGDFIERQLTPGLREALAQDEDFAKQVKFRRAGKVMMVTPTKRGWGHGLFQIDFASHIPFIATGKWRDPRAAMEYSMKNVLVYGRDKVRAAFPTMSEGDLLYATIATYNAGPTNVIKALKKGVPVRLLDQGTKFQKGGTRVTFGINYVVHILKTASELAPTGMV